MRADRRQHLIVLRGQDEDVVLFGRDGPTRNIFSNDFASEWLWSLEFGDRGYVEPGITDRAVDTTTLILPRSIAISR